MITALTRTVSKNSTTQRDVTALSRLEYVEPIDRRISACILGVPS